MADLISRAVTIEYLMTNLNWHNEDGYEVDDADEKRAIITDLVNGIPAVDAVPMVHGRWKAILNPFWDAECSVCGYAKKNGWEWGFCPHCGAKMDG